MYKTQQRAPYFYILNQVLPLRLLCIFKMDVLELFLLCTHSMLQKTIGLCESMSAGRVNIDKLYCLHLVFIDQAIIFPVLIGLICFMYICGLDVTLFMSGSH